MDLFTAQKANIEQEFFSGIDDPNASGRDKLGVQRIEKRGYKKGQPRPPFGANVIRSYFVTVVVVGQ